MITALSLFLLVILIEAFFQTKPGEKIGNFLPTPFWIYFIPTVLATFGVFHHDDKAFGIFGLHLLPMALVLLLIGTPVTALFRLGGKATAAMALGSLTVVIATFISFILLIKILPAESSMAAHRLGLSPSGLQQPRLLWHFEFRSRRRQENQKNWLQLLLWLNYQSMLWH